jgi:4-amino-4-deoxy-L-arabinose transferase-like glycosyltransferase
MTRPSVMADLAINERRCSVGPGHDPMAAKHNGVCETVKRPAARTSLIVLMILVGAGIVYYAALSPENFGRAHDDSIYVTTAKALATGHGYRIISLPYEPAQTKYPPFYPFLLSLIWRLYPQFPQNLVPMMLLTVAATLGFLAVSYCYLVRNKYGSTWQALVVLALAAINWRTVALVTTLYSEMVYAVLSVLALYLAEEYEKRDSGWLWAALTGVVIGLAFMTRSLGVTLLIALAAYSLRRRRWKKALVPLAVGSVFVIGWALWCSVNRTTADGANVAYYTSYVGHINQVITSLHSQSNTPKWLVLLGLFGRNTLMFTVISPVVVVLGVDYTPAQYFGFVSLFILAGFIRQARQGFRLLHIYILCYIAMAALVPFPSYDRYLVPVIPFVLLFTVAEAGRLSILIRNEFVKNGRMIRQFSAAFIGLALLISAGTILYNHSSEVLQRIGPFHKTAKPAPEDVEAIEWINQNTNSSDVLVCYHDPAYFLYTGRKASRSLPMEEWVDWREDRTSVETVENLVFRSLEQDKGRYLVVTSADFEAEDQSGRYGRILGSIIDSHPNKFTPVFNSRDGRSKIFRVENGE